MIFFSKIACFKIGKKRIFAAQNKDAHLKFAIN
jgi:hypothetical protein